MPKYQPIIGLEIHAQLKTNTKMFCGCLNNPDEKKANTDICPICMGHPGVLPVINKKAIEDVIKTGLSLNCKVAKKTWFERKNYFYPDLPKGYQITQYEAPLCTNGYLKIGDNKIRVRRVHLEEDTGRLLHSEDCSLVDFNRAGIPLMEMVTEPGIFLAQEAKKFCEELRLILRYLGVSNADMEKGQMRCEANISLKTNGNLGVKVEVKNLNSFKAVERAIDYEIKRQRGLLEEGEKIIQETRGWNENKQKTFSQRSKEEAEDYRYFPEPDLPILKIVKGRGLIDVEKIKAEVPELPQQRRERFKREYRVFGSDVEVLVSNKGLGEYFEKVISELKIWDKTVHGRTQSPKHLFKIVKLTANYLITNLQRLIYESKEVDIEKLKITPENFAEFTTLIHQDKISRSTVADNILEEMFKTGKDPSEIAAHRNLFQVSDKKELEKMVSEILKNNPKVVEDYKKGKENALQFLVGQVMAATKGRANPQVVSEILKKYLT